MTPHMQHPMHPAELSPERYSGEETDNQHTVLPIHCVVQVTGNNRTKLSLLGQRGVIVQAGDLGGWHTLVLESGEQVRLQRNALTVLDYPAGTGLVRAHGAHCFQLSSHTIALHMLHTQDRQPTSSAGYRTPPPGGYSAYSGPVKQQMKRVGKPSTRINFDQLGNNALRKYRMHYNLNSVGPHSPRMDLVSAVEKHFSEQVVDEQSVMAALFEALGRRR